MSDTGQRTAEFLGVVIQVSSSSRLRNERRIVLHKARTTPQVDRMHVDHPLRLSHRISVCFGEQHDIANDRAIGCKEAGVIPRRDGVLRGRHAVNFYETGATACGCN